MEQLANDSTLKISISADKILTLSVNSYWSFHLTLSRIILLKCLANLNNIVVFTGTNHHNQERCQPYSGINSLQQDLCGSLLLRKIYVCLVVFVNTTDHTLYNKRATSSLHNILLADSLNMQPHSLSLLHMKLTMYPKVLEIWIACPGNVSPVFLSPSEGEKPMPDESKSWCQ